MDLAGAIKQVSEFDAKFRDLTKKVDEILLVQRRNNRKMMDQVYRKGIQVELFRSNDNVRAN